MYSDLRNHGADPMPHVTVPGGEMVRFRAFATTTLASVGIGERPRGMQQPWAPAKRFDGNVPAFLNRLLGLSIERSPSQRLPDFLRR